MNIPNTITFVRILLIPVFIVFLLLPSQRYQFAAGIIFAIVSFTDAVDGFIARRQKTITSFGKFLDPIADKLLVTAALIFLIGKGVPAWMAFIIIAREFLITGLRLSAQEKGKVIAASWLGKLKTITQMVAIFLVLIRFPFSYYFLLAAVILTVISAIDYLAKLWPYLLEGKSPKQRGN